MPLHRVMQFLRHLKNVSCILQQTTLCQCAAGFSGNPTPGFSGDVTHTWHYWASTASKIMAWPNQTYTETDPPSALRVHSQCCALQITWATPPSIRGVSIMYSPTLFSGISEFQVFFFFFRLLEDSAYHVRSNTRGTPQGLETTRLTSRQLTQRSSQFCRGSCPP